MTSLVSSLCTDSDALEEVILACSSFTLHSVGKGLLETAQPVPFIEDNSTDVEQGRTIFRRGWYNDEQPSI
jgi:hypothetical protein